MKTQTASPEITDIFERIQSRGLFFIVLAIILLSAQNFISSLAATQVRAWIRIEITEEKDDVHLLQTFAQSWDSHELEANLATDPDLPLGFYTS
jgi:hypothetical protein